MFYMKDSDADDKDDEEETSMVEEDDLDLVRVELLCN